MWSQASFDGTRDFRQGDLLQGLVLPRLKTPLTYGIIGGTAATGGETVLIGSDPRPRNYVVMSQCCTIENSRVLAVAPVVSTKTLGQVELEQYRASIPDASGYVVGAQWLQDLPPFLVARTGALQVADFTQIQTYNGDLDSFLPSRVARMTPQAREELRIRLMRFWGRAEAGDLEELQGGQTWPEPP